MILHPVILALLVGSILICTMVIIAAWHSFQILRYWDLASGSELQLKLERKTYLISTVLGNCMLFQLASLFLFIYAADVICPFFVGAMCAVGSLGVNAYGYPTLFLKVVNFIAIGIWLILNHCDNKGYDYPLIRVKYRLFLLAAPLLVGETVLLWLYITGLTPDIITSCCGSLFSSNSRSIPAELAGLPVKTMIWGYYVTLIMTVGSGIYFVGKLRGGLLFSALNGLLCVVSILSIISFISIYIYELPSHHCPFCLLQKEYHYLGYPLYLSLLLGTVAGIGAGILQRFRDVSSLAETLPIYQRKLAVVALGAHLFFAVLATYQIVNSNYHEDTAELWPKSGGSRSLTADCIVTRIKIRLNSGNGGHYENKKTEKSRQKGENRTYLAHYGNFIPEIRQFPGCF